MRALDYSFEKQSLISIYNRTLLAECKLKLSKAESLLDMLSKCLKEVQSQVLKLHRVQFSAQGSYDSARGCLITKIYSETNQLEAHQREYSGLFWMDPDAWSSGVDHPRERDRFQEIQAATLMHKMSVIEDKKRSLGLLHQQIGPDGDIWRTLQEEKKRIHEELKLVHKRSAQLEKDMTTLKSNIGLLQKEENMLKHNANL